MSPHWEEGEEKDDQTGVSLWKTKSWTYFTMLKGPCQPNRLPKGKGCHRWIDLEIVIQTKFSFFSGMVGSTGVNGTDDSDELMRKLRALWDFQRRSATSFQDLLVLLVWQWDIRPINRTKWDTSNILSVVSPYTNRRLCDNCTNHTSIWTSKTQNTGQLEES